MRKYITMQGDMWDMICFREYKVKGSEKLMSMLISANEEYAEYVKFSAGIELNIPEADIPAVKNLPPWID
ncbi:MAG: tail protein X [Synergistaceae bacterium]|nr:tail protein X [Synergistaceae bacterium]MBQ3448623.1 tail protein X [Synergistaceae bacterium]MBQ3694986.1 tail protein X [Synergistaceae bacterium]MBQ6111997.1 tail protein X [Synergistaceae bacterium]MBQ9628377.1 tail protein X [Synergistaceae bacterium]